MNDTNQKKTEQRHPTCSHKKTSPPSQNLIRVHENKKSFRIMTKSDISYASVPTTSTPPDDSHPYVQGFAIGSTHAVTVIVDENTARPNPDVYAPESPSSYLQGARRPVHLSMCPHCHKANIRTSTRTYPSAATWIGVVATGLCFLPIAWVPLVIDSCKQTDHFCQNCGKKIGTVKPLEGCFVKERV